MDSSDLSDVERRARVRYELMRAKRALLGFAPVLVLAALAASLGQHPSWALAFGASVFAVGAVFLWYGRDLKRAVLPGLGAGILPLAIALCAKHVGHACVGDGCMMVCVPACTIGGLAAGVAVAVIGFRRRAGLAFWLGASAIAILTGAMGCACAGYAGVVGLAFGYLTGLAPVLVHRIFPRRPS